MYQITLKIDGMACSMCESHVCDTIRNQFKVKKVSASHAKGEAVIVSETELSEAELKAALDPTGYKLLGYACEPYEKKGGLFSIFTKSKRFLQAPDAGFPVSGIFYAHFTVLH